MAHLNSTRDVIDALGGVSAVAALTERTYNAAWNWTTFKTFPADTADAMRGALVKTGHTAPSSLWRMVGSGSSPKRKREKAA